MHVELVSVIADDYRAAIDFFVDKLRFELVEDSAAITNDGRPKRWVLVRPPGARTALLLAQADSNAQRAVVGKQHAGRVGLVLRVDDFDVEYDRLRSVGIRFVAGSWWDLLGPTA